MPSKYRNANSVTVSDKYIRVPTAVSTYRSTLVDDTDPGTDEASPGVADALPGVSYDYATVPPTLTPFQDEQESSGDMARIPSSSETIQSKYTPIPYDASNTSLSLNPSPALVDTPVRVPAAVTSSRKASMPLSAPSGPAFFNKVGTSNDDFSFFIPHGDEISAHQTLQDYYRNGGTGSALVSNTDTRNGPLPVDPNQSWRLPAGDPTRTQVEKQLAAGGPGQLLIALHNTTGGALDAEKRKSTAITRNDPTYGGYILTNNKDLYQNLKGLPYNVILQDDVTPQNNDFSTSRWATGVGKPYVNVEALRGDFKKQTEMMQEVMKAWKLIKTRR